MWDIMAFFRGGINGEGAHDDLGKEIALAGKEWVRDCYRWADLEAYQFRCVLTLLSRLFQGRALMLREQDVARVREVVHGRDGAGKQRL